MESKTFGKLYNNNLLNKYSEANTFVAIYHKLIVFLAIGTTLLFMFVGLGAGSELGITTIGGLIAGTIVGLLVSTIIFGFILTITELKRGVDAINTKFESVDKFILANETTIVELLNNLKDSKMTKKQNICGIFKCKCGFKKRVDISQVGKKGRCPQCLEIGEVVNDE